MSKTSLLNSSCLRHWGESCFFGAKEIKAVVEIPTEETTIGSIDLELPDPSLLMKAADAKLLTRNDLIIVRAEIYAVVKILPDGTNFAKVIIAPGQDTQPEGDWR